MPVGNPSRIQVAKALNDIKPNYSYVVLALTEKNQPYKNTGTMWVYSNGDIYLYCDGINESGFVYGSYVICNI